MIESTAHSILILSMAVLDWLASGDVTTACRFSYLVFFPHLDYFRMIEDGSMFLCVCHYFVGYVEFVECPPNVGKHFGSVTTV